MNAQGSIFHNSQNVEITQMVLEITQIINGQVDVQNVT